MSPEPDRPRAGELSWRMDAVERKVEKVAEAVEDVPVIKERISSLRDELEAIKRVLWTIAGGLVLLVVSVLIAAASIGGG